MDIKRIQIDISYYTPKVQREIIKLIKDNDQEVDIANYQDYFIFRYCDQYECFRLFEEEKEGLVNLNKEELYKHFKTSAVKYYAITEKEYKSLKKHHEEIGKILEEFKIRR